MNAREDDFLTHAHSSVQVLNRVLLLLLHFVSSCNEAMIT